MAIELVTLRIVPLPQRNNSQRVVAMETVLPLMPQMSQLRSLARVYRREAHLQPRWEATVL